MSDQRERFEAWASKQGINLARFDRYRYAGVEAKAAWAAWQAACPEGWQAVPVEPTSEMLFAAEIAALNQEKDMCSATPSPEENQGCWPTGYYYKELLAAAPRPEDV